MAPSVSVPKIRVKAAPSRGHAPAVAVGSDKACSSRVGHGPDRFKRTQRRHARRRGPRHLQDVAGLRGKSGCSPACWSTSTDSRMRVPLVAATARRRRAVSTAGPAAVTRREDSEPISPSAADPAVHRQVAKSGHDAELGFPADSQRGQRGVDALRGGQRVAARPGEFDIDAEHGDRAVGARVALDAPVARTAAATASPKCRDRNTASCGSNVLAMASRLRQSTQTSTTSFSTASGACGRSDGRSRGRSNATTAMSPAGRSWQASRIPAPAWIRSSVARSVAPGARQCSSPRITRTRQVEQRARPPHSATCAT